MIVVRSVEYDNGMITKARRDEPRMPPMAKMWLRIK